MTELYKAFNGITKYCQNISGKKFQIPSYCETISQGFVQLFSFYIQLVQCTKLKLDHKLLLNSITLYSFFLFLFYKASISCFLLCKVSRNLKRFKSFRNKHQLEKHQHRILFTCCPVYFSASNADNQQCKMRAKQNNIRHISIYPGLTFISEGG